MFKWAMVVMLFCLCSAYLSYMCSDLALEELLPQKRRHRNIATKDTDHLNWLEEVSQQTLQETSSGLQPADSLFRVLVVFGTRPEAVKLAPVIQRLRTIPSVQCITVCTDQHTSIIQPVLQLFQISPDFHLHTMHKNQTLTHISISVLRGLSYILARMEPHVVVVQGDTTTAFMAALSSFYNKIPVAHVEAGLRTFDINSPFPEEVNRQAITTMSTFHFAPTHMASQNLQINGKSLNHVYVTGNTVVDALKHVSGLPQSTWSVSLQNRVAEGSTICLVTTHRRENQGPALRNILAAIDTLIQDHIKLVVVFPMHPNPNVRAAIQQFFDGRVLPDRLMLIEPLGYEQLIQTIQISYLVLTDSGGIQEEAAALGTPALVLRESTERMEGVLAGAAALTGTDTAVIIRCVSELLRNSSIHQEMTHASKAIYGNGDAAEKIVALIMRHEQGLVKRMLYGRQVNLQPFMDAMNKYSPQSPTQSFKILKDAISQSATPGIKLPHNHLLTSQGQYAAIKEKALDLHDYEVVLVLTVWRRETLQSQLEMIAAQNPTSMWKVVVFQNGNYLNVTKVLETWKGHQNMQVSYMQSVLPTGYYGRFLVPLLWKARYFFVFDDDVIFGNLYIQNCIRVIDSGSLCTRNGRFIIPQTDGTLLEDYGKAEEAWKAAGTQVAFNQDITYDFGGHIWAGETSWLQVAWQHPPPTWADAEDFWLSAVLKLTLGVTTKRPRCPSSGSIHNCACSMHEALNHIVTDVEQKPLSRNGAMMLIAQQTSFSGLFVEQPDAKQRYYDDTYNMGTFWSVEGTVFADCLFYS